MANLKNSEIIEALKEKTLLELKELVDLMKDEFGVDPSAVSAAPAASAEAAEQTEFTVTLESWGQNKIAVIKVVRAITGLGLKEAKVVVESAPVDFKENVSREEADEIKEQLDVAGAIVLIK